MWKLAEAPAVSQQEPSLSLRQPRPSALSRTAIGPLGPMIGAHFVIKGCLPSVPFQDEIGFRCCGRSVGFLHQAFLGRGRSFGVSSWALKQGERPRLRRGRAHRPRSQRLAPALSRITSHKSDAFAALPLRSAIFTSRKILIMVCLGGSAARLGRTAVSSGARRPWQRDPRNAALRRRALASNTCDSIFQTRLPLLGTKRLFRWGRANVSEITTVPGLVVAALRGALQNLRTQAEQNTKSLSAGRAPHGPAFLQVLLQRTRGLQHFEVCNSCINLSCTRPLMWPPPSCCRTTFCECTETSPACMFLPSGPRGLSAFSRSVFFFLPGWRRTLLHPPKNWTNGSTSAYGREPEPHRGGA